MSSPEEELLDAVVQTSHTVVAVLSQVAAAHDVSLTQLRVLAILRDREPRMAELAGYLGLDRSTITGLVDRAAARGLVRRVASPHDGRSVHVALTDAGRALAAEGAREIAGRLAPLFDPLGAAERGQLTSLLRTMLD